MSGHAPPVDPARARRRAQHLTRKARRLPIGSNGREKAIDQAAELLLAAAMADAEPEREAEPSRRCS